MKTSTKLLIGISATAALGTATAFIASEKLIKTFQHMASRKRLRTFVNEKLNGNEKLLDLIDDLSDAELETVFTLFSKIKDEKKRISINGDKVKDITEELKHRLQRISSDRF